MVYVRGHARALWPLGRARGNWVVLRRGSPLLQETRALSIRPRRVPRWRRTNRGAAAAGDSPHRAGVSRCRRAGRLRAERGLQRRGAGRVSRLRWVVQSSSANGAGSPVPGARAWRMMATMPSWDKRAKRASAAAGNDERKRGATRAAARSRRVIGSCGNGVVIGAGWTKLAPRFGSFQSRSACKQMVGWQKRRATAGWRRR